MSLQYLIDGYNVIHHPLFRQAQPRSRRPPQSALLDLIRVNRLCGSSGNSVIVFFDGRPWPGYDAKSFPGCRCVFAHARSADEKIVEWVDASVRPKDIVVVSDDRQISVRVRLGAGRMVSVEDFLAPLARRQRTVSSEEIKAAAGVLPLTYLQRQQIDRELRQRWLR